MAKAKKRTKSKKSAKAKKPEKVYKSFRLTKNRPIHNAGHTFPTSWQLIKSSLKLIANNKKILFFMSIIFAIIYVLFMKSSTGIGDGEVELIDELAGDQNALVRATLAGALIGSGSALGTEAGSIFTAIVLIVMSLAFIWAIRHMYAGNTFRLRDPYYQGMGSLIPFGTLSIIISLQFLPFVIGATIYGYVSLSTGALTGVENLLFIFFWMTMTLLSAYWLTTSVLALYAVTLHNMGPIEAMRGVKEAVQYRRAFVFRRMITPVVLIFTLFFISFLLTVAATPRWAIFPVDLFTVISLPLIHVYNYHLYRSLL